MGGSQTGPGPSEVLVKQRVGACLHSACAEPDQGVSVANAPSARRWCRLAWSGPRIACQQAGVLKSHQRCPLGCGHAGLLLGQRQTCLAEAGISLAPSARSSLCGCPSLNSTSAWEKMDAPNDMQDMALYITRTFCRRAPHFMSFLSEESVSA